MMAAESMNMSSAHIPAVLRINGTQEAVCNMSVIGCTPYGPFPNNLLVIIFFSVMAVVGTAANLLVLVAILGFRLLKRPASLYVCTMVVADLFLSGGYAPYCVVRLVAPPVAGCEAMGLAMNAALFVSFLSLTCVAINRYLVVALPQCRYERVYSAPLTALSLTLIWAVSAVFTAPLVLGHGEVGVDRRLGICTVSLADTSSVVLEAVVSLGVGMPCVLIIIAAYVGVWRRFRRSMRAVHQHAASGTGREGWRLSGNLFVITMVTCLCWMPSHLLVLVDIDGTVSDLLYQLIVLLSLTQSFLNPILHLVLNSNAAKAYQVVTRRLSHSARRQTTTRVETNNL